MIEGWVFMFSALIALVSALAMVVSKHAVHAALYLVATQIALAVLFLLQGAFFIAALQVIVYAGAIMVLFVFVIMLLGVDQKEALLEPLEFQRPLAIGLGLVLIAEALYLGTYDLARGLAARADVRPLAGEGNVESIARILFTRWAFPFEVTSVLLVVAVVGVMVLARRRA
ncbi:MAG TPA: NADH-quinone oxidoreductase subunit J [Actinomycetota bacterium]|nr:NADH-quinone oxidoreductase subunit J [Actinomycetota bacterium]